MDKHFLVVVLIALSCTIYGNTNSLLNTAPPLPPIVDLGADTSICPGESLLLDATVTGSATYLWQDGSTNPTFSVTQEGAYSVTVTEGGESASDTINVSVFDIPDFNLGQDTTLCAGDSLEIDVSEYGVNVLWPDGSRGDRYTLTSTTRVLVEFRTDDGCWVSDDIEATFVPQPPVELGEDIEICEGESAVLDASVAGNVSYVWNDGSTEPIRTEMTGGTYAVTVSDGGCAASDSVNLTVNAVPVIDLGPDTSICDGEPLTLDVSEFSGSVFWPDGSTGSTYTVMQTTRLEVQVFENGCTATDEIQITYNEPPVLDLGPPTVSLCQDEPYVIQTQDPSAAYIWNDGSTKTSLTVDQSGTYWVEAEKNGCISTDTIEVELNSEPQLDLGGSIDACEGEAVTLDAGNPGATITWQDGTTGPLFTVLESGTYSVTVEAGACLVEEQVSVQFRFTPEVDLGEDLSACTGEVLTLEPFVSNADILRWQDGSSGFSLQVNTSGLYWLEAEVDGCTDRDSVFVTFQGAQLIDLGEDRAVCDDQATFLRAGSSGDNVRWSTGASGTTLLVEEPGLYWVEVDDGICAARDSVELEFLPCGTDNIYVPSAFSPNGDDSNEELQVFIHPAYEVMEYQIYIFDRWGGLVFEARDPNATWDGRIDGIEAQEGVYVYMIEVTFMDGQGVTEGIKYGDVSVIR